MCVAFVRCIFFTHGSHTLRLSQSHLSGLFIRCGTRASFSQNVVSSCQRNMIFVHKFAPWSSLKLKLFYAVSSISHVFCCSFSPWVTWLSIPQSLYYVLKNRVIWDLGPCFSYGSGAKKIKTNISTWPECSQWRENWTVKLLALLPLGNTVTSLLRPLFGRLTNRLYIFLYQKKKPSLIRSPVNTANFIWPIGDRINGVPL